MVCTTSKTERELDNIVAVWMGACGFPAYASHSTTRGRLVHTKRRPPSHYSMRRGIDISESRSRDAECRQWLLCTSLVKAQKSGPKKFPSSVAIKADLDTQLKHLLPQLQPRRGHWGLSSGLNSIFCFFARNVENWVCHRSYSGLIVHLGQAVCHSLRQWVVVTYLIPGNWRKWRKSAGIGTHKRSRRYSAETLGMYPTFLVADPSWSALSHGLLNTVRTRRLFLAVRCLVGRTFTSKKPWLRDLCRTFFPQGNCTMRSNRVWLLVLTFRMPDLQSDLTKQYLRS